MIVSCRLLLLCIALFDLGDYASNLGSSDELLRHTHTT